MHAVRCVRGAQRGDQGQAKLKQHWSDFNYNSGALGHGVTPPLQDASVLDSA
jgi:hypothetical protein